MRRGRNEPADPDQPIQAGREKTLADLLTAEWTNAAYCLINGLPLPESYRDHALSGNWTGFRECHIKPELLLIYEQQDDSIQLVWLGSHSELF